MPTEVEAKFRATGPEPLDRLRTLASLGRATLGDARTADEVDRYLDTADGALGDRRWACRLRTRADRTIVSLKGPPDGPIDGWLHRRPEVEGPATASPDPADWPDGEARRLVDDLRRGEPLLERLRLLQRRTERSVDVAGSRIGTLSLDEVAIVHRGAELGTFHAVELELTADAAPDAAALLGDLAAELGAMPGLEPDRLTKLEHALALLPAR